MIEQKKKFNGVVKFMRNEDSDTSCVCCEGNHIFCRYVDFKEKFETVIREMLDECTTKDKEGRKVTMEIKIKLHDAFCENQDALHESEELA